MNILEQYFKVGQVAELTGFPARNISDWASRGHIKASSGGSPVGGGIQGKDRHYTFRNVMQVAIAGELMTKFDIPLAAAMRAPLIFAYTGADGREPGVPFESGDAYIALRSLGTNGECIDTLPMNPMMPDGQESNNVILWVNAGDVFRTICKRLDLNAQAVIDRCYGGVV